MLPFETDIGVINPDYFLKEDGSGELRMPCFESCESSHGNCNSSTEQGIAPQCSCPNCCTPSCISGCDWQSGGGGGLNMPTWQCNCGACNWGYFLCISGCLAVLILGMGVAQKTISGQPDLGSGGKSGNP